MPAPYDCFLLVTNLVAAYAPAGQRHRYHQSWPKGRSGGENGCGKSTLLSLLKNEISADGGSRPSRQLVLALVNQGNPALPCRQSIMSLTAIEDIASWRPRPVQRTHDGHAIATVHGKLDAIDASDDLSRAASLLHGLGFTNSLSGRSAIFLRVAGVSALTRPGADLPPDLLLLDEPTNHLDLDV